MNIEILKTKYRDIAKGQSVIFIPYLMVGNIVAQKIFSCFSGVILIGFKSDFKNVGGKSSHKYLSPAAALKALKEEEVYGRVFVISPEIYSCTLNSCIKIEIGEDVYAVSAFLELFFRLFEGLIFTIEIKNRFIILECFTNADRGIHGIFSSHVKLLNYLEVNGQSIGILNKLNYSNVISDEIHRALILQYYLNSQSLADKSKQNELRKIVDKKKRELFLYRDKIDA